MELPGNETGRQFRGVYQRSCGAWSARIYHPHKEASVHLGTFVTIEHAAIAYDEAALKFHGRRAKLNFPGLLSTEHNYKRVKKCSRIHDPAASADAAYDEAPLGFKGSSPRLYFPEGIPTPKLDLLAEYASELLASASQSAPASQQTSRIPDTFDIDRYELWVDSEVTKLKMAQMRKARVKDQTSNSGKRVSEYGIDWKARRQRSVRRSPLKKRMRREHNISNWPPRSGYKFKRNDPSSRTSYPR